jgi:GNAT superfamily N-acetyltransferase
LSERLRSTGWIEALVVDPGCQRQGLGRDLLAWAMYKLRSEGADKIHLGGGFRHFFPGIPGELPGLPEFFSKAGFARGSTVYDLRGNLRNFVAPPSARAAIAAVGAECGPCQEHDVPALLEFLQAEFPGRWRFDSKRFLDLGGAPQDFVILRQGLRVIGFAHIHHPRSVFLGPPAYWRKLLGRRYGGLGPIGVAAGMRGKDLGLALLQLALEYDASLGVDDAVIDWTTLLGFYGRVGFTPWKTYVRMES